MSISAHTERSSLLHYRANGTGILLVIWLLSTMSLWFFAFYDLPAEVPDWVRRAQVACFGSDESGMPGAAGWMLLLLSPALLLFAIFLALGQEAVSFLKSWSSSRISMLIALTLGSAVIMEAGWVVSSINARIAAFTDEGYNISSAKLPDSYPIGRNKAPDFVLLDQFGQEKSLTSFGGKPIFLSFIFAHCQAVCPTLVKTIQSASKNISPGKIHVVLITLDPWRDTPASLPNLAKKWELGPNQWILSGAPDQVNAVLDSYNIPRQRDINNGDVLHPSIVHVINSKGELSYSFNSPSDKWLEQAVQRISPDS